MSSHLGCSRVLGVPALARAVQVAAERKASKMKGNLTHGKLEMRQALQGMRDSRGEWLNSKSKAEQRGEAFDAPEPHTVAQIEELDQQLKELDKKQKVEKKHDETAKASAFRLDDINRRNAEFQKKIEEEVGRRSRSFMHDAHPVHSVRSAPLRPLHIVRACAAAGGRQDPAAGD